MMVERSLEGWSPTIGGGVTLHEVVDLAFDYRGDVTIVRSDGTEVIGYVYNRNRDVPEPFLQLFDPTGASHTFRYAEVRTVRFTGRDTAAGKSYEAWLRRKTQAEESAPPA
ncbi:MAG: hypothetical protein AUH29_03890 [Candidatus Rokubacteria bacterium 13_1_40CM_69_27]|nr:MAG: hypothetical protein AUH29_03890 [Candidatus Rokubacteria bacterium 13_1_40CM_69_27]